MAKRSLKKIKRHQLPFVHLHSHDEHSLKDGVGTVEDYINRASEMDQMGFTITNHGSNAQWVRQYFHMKDVNKFRASNGQKEITNIFGEEVYIMNNRDESLKRIKEIAEILAGFKKSKKGTPEVIMKLQEERKALNTRYHLVLLAKNQKGFDNLLYIHNEAMMNGYYYKPNVSLELLEKHSEGIIALSACMGGVVAKHIRNDDMRMARKITKRYKKIFGDDFYMELQLLDMKEQIELNKELLVLAEEMDIKTVITNDSHYIYKDDWEAQGTLTLVNSNGKWKDKEDPNKKAWVFDSQQLWYKTESELFQSWKKWHSDYMDYEIYKNSILETVNISEKVSGDINFREDENHIPKYCDSDKEAEKILKSKINKGFKEKGLIGKKEYIERAKYELEVIDYKKAKHYFLIVADYIEYAKKKYGKEAVGDGRGSGASSLVNWCLNITDIDPLFWNLPFERFLSKGRKDMPDIDSDFLPWIRDDIKRYLIEKYGQTYTASIATYGTYQTKAVIDDVLRVYDFPIAEAKALKKTLSEGIDSMDDWDDILKANPKLEEFSEEYPNIFYVITRLRGQVRHMSKHAGGVLITRNPIMNDISLTRVGDTLCSSWVEGQTRSELGRIGRTKFDILGLETLAELKYCNDMIEEKEGKRIDWDKTNLLNDKESVKICAKGETKWIFQFQNPGMIQLLKNAKIKCLADWSAISALGRPGPKNSGMADIFGKRSRGKEKFELHPVVEPVLAETFGVITYQEQVMLLGVHVGDFTMDEADELRKILTKVKAETEHIYGPRRDELKEKFIKNGSKKMDKKDVITLWDNMVEFTKYGFNKAHAVCYGKISSKCLYMLAHYPVEYYASVLNSQSTKFQDGEESKLAYYLKEARMDGYKVVFPEINNSNWRVAVNDRDEILYGLSFVKGIGEKPAKLITGKHYSKIENFFNERFSGTVAGKRVMEPLIKIGYFDSIFENRKQIWEAYTRWNDDGKKNDFRIDLMKFSNVEDWTDTEKMKLEYQYLGMYSKQHPIEVYSDLKEEYDLCSLEEAKDMTECSVLGMLVSLKPYKSKSGMMAFTEFEDENSKMSITLFKDDYAKYKEMLKPGGCFALKVKINSKGCSVNSYAKGEPVMSMDDLLPKKHKNSKIQKKKKKKS